MTVQISSASYESPGATLLSRITVGHTIPAWGQTATVSGPAAVSIQISSGYLEVPDAGLPARSLSAIQQIPAWQHAASMFQPIGSIDGGGQISEEHVHLSARAMQTIPAWSQSAAIGEEGALGPISMQAAQQIPAWVPLGRMDVVSDCRVAQQVPAWGQAATVYRELPITVDQQIPAWSQAAQISEAPTPTRLLSAIQSIPAWTQVATVAPDLDVRAYQQIPSWTQAVALAGGITPDDSVENQIWVVRPFSRTWRVTT